MSSTETIDQLWSNIAAKLRGYKIDGMEADLDLFRKEVQDSINIRDATAASTLVDCQHYRMRATFFADELLANRSYVDNLLNHRRRLDEACRVAAIRIDDMREHIARLWAVLKPEWRLVEAEVTCLCCFRKLWHAVCLVPCGHIVCASCTFKKFKKLRNIGENVQLVCITCESVVTQRPIRAGVVENVVKTLPRVNDEGRRRYEEEARGQGFIGEHSWSLFFK